MRRALREEVSQPGRRSHVRGQENRRYEVGRGGLRWAEATATVLGVRR
jgi:hypothetical protein